MKFPRTSFPAEERSIFVSEMATAIGDTAQSNYGDLFEERQCTRNLISDHIHLNRFLARLLSALNGTGNEQERIMELDDALLILSTGLEGHAESHDLPDVDIPAAAQYVIHAGEVFFEECKKE